MTAVLPTFPHREETENLALDYNTHTLSLTHPHTNDSSAFSIWFALNAPVTLYLYARGVSVPVPLICLLVPMAPQSYLSELFGGILLSTMLSMVSIWKHIYILLLSILLPAFLEAVTVVVPSNCFNSSFMCECWNHRLAVSLFINLFV